MAILEEGRSIRNVGSFLYNGNSHIKTGYILIELKKIDSHGRVVLPPVWRKKLQSNEVFIVEDGNVLLVIPKDDPDLSRYIDFLKLDISPEIYSDYHQLKNYLLGDRK